MHVCRLKKKTGAQVCDVMQDLFPNRTIYNGLTTKKAFELNRIHHFTLLLMYSYAKTINKE